MTTEDPTKEEFSFKEGVQYAGLALGLVALLAYLAIVLTRVFTDDVSVTKVAWQGPMLLVVAVGGGVYAIGYGIARLVYKGRVDDVRDKEIERYGEALNGALVGLTVFISIILLALDVEPFWVAHNLFLGGWWASFVSTAGRVAAYREGIPA